MESNVFRYIVQFVNDFFLFFVVVVRDSFTPVGAALVDISSENIAGR